MESWSSLAYDTTLTWSKSSVQIRAAPLGGGVVDSKRLIATGHILCPVIRDTIESVRTTAQAARAVAAGSTSMTGIGTLVVFIALVVLSALAAFVIKRALFRRVRSVDGHTAA